jgi:hypothetical protein
MAKDLQDGQRQRDGAAGEREQQERDHLRDGVGEDVEDELTHVVVDLPSRCHGSDDGGEVVVGEHHRRRFPGHVGARAPHGDADVGSAQRGGVVDAVAGHGDHLAGRAQCFGDAQLYFR